MNKIDPKDVRLLRHDAWNCIKKKVSPPHSYYASKYGISKVAVQAILYGLTWKSLEDIDPDTPTKIGAPRGRKGYSADPRSKKGQP